MATHNEHSQTWRWILLAFCAGTALTVACGFDAATTGGAGGQGSGNAPGTGNVPGTGNTPGVGGSGTGNAPATGGTGTGTTAGTGPTAGTSTTAGTGAGGNPATGAKNYTITGTWPAQGSAVPLKPGALTYQKVTLHTRFLAESCSIADYNNDGIPDVSAGRRWYEGPFRDAAGAPTPLKEHIYRGGHDDLPRDGLSPELVTGVSDDWACYPFDMDGDGNTDIINIASCDVDENKTPQPNPKPQAHATAFWYKNPGPGGLAANTMWQPYAIHTDVRLEQHGLVDVDGDGKPEIFGACKGCNPLKTKGYYFNPDWANPTQSWQFRAVTRAYEFPFEGETGWLHGLGFGDVNGDGKPDLLERGGIWTDVTAAAPNMGAWNQVILYGGTGNDGGELGGSHMYAADVDGDGDNDVISADFAHRTGISWWENNGMNMMTFTKHKFVGGPEEKANFGGIGFSQPHAMQVVDMDADNVPDVVVGKMRFAHPDGYGDPDLQGTPVSYVFKIKRNTPSFAGSVTFEPHAIDTSNDPAGVGRQLAVGHVDTDGIMDMCTANKKGLFVYFGQ